MATQTNDNTNATIHNSPKYVYDVQMRTNFWNTMLTLGVTTNIKPKDEIWELCLHSMRLNTREFIIELKSFAQIPSATHTSTVLFLEPWTVNV